MHELTQLIKDDMRPALGVTEPGAIAYAVSKAKSYNSGELEQVTLLLNSGMYKMHIHVVFQTAIFMGTNTQQLLES